MRATGFYAVLFVVARWTQAVGVAATALIGASLEWGEKCRPSLPSWVQGVPDWINDRPWLILVAIGVGGVAQAAKSWAGEPWAWEAITAWLEQLHLYVFDAKEVGNDREHCHRVTLFEHRRRKRWWHLWSVFSVPQWLVPIARHPNLTQRTDSAFLAHEEGKCEGIAGEAWLRRKVFYIENLPIITDASPDLDVEDYARKTNVTKEWVKKRLKEKKQIPQSMAGVLVQLGGRRWGVLVIDSQRPTIKAVTQQIWNLILDPFSTILERAKP